MEQSSTQFFFPPLSAFFWYLRQAQFYYEIDTPHYKWELLKIVQKSSVWFFVKNVTCKNVMCLIVVRESGWNLINLLKVDVLKIIRGCFYYWAIFLHRAYEKTKQIHFPVLVCFCKLRAWVIQVWKREIILF